MDRYILRFFPLIILFFNFAQILVVNANKYAADYNVQLSLALEPEFPEPGGNFLLKCTESALPEPDRYTITFYLNDTVLCKYQINTANDNFIFESTTTPLLNVFPSRHSNYEVLIQPNTVQPLGKFQCSINFNTKRNGGYPLWYYSGVLDTSSVRARKSTIPQAGVSLLLNKEPNSGMIEVCCRIQLVPNNTDYKVLFLLESKPVAEYSVQTTKSTPLVYWNVTSDYESLNIYRGPHSQYPEYSALFQLNSYSNFNQNELYRCLLTVALQPAGSGTAKFYSEHKSLKFN